MGPNILSLARSFSEIEHARDFASGKVRMQTIDYFRKFEHTDRALRGDAYDGSGFFHPSQIAYISIGDFRIPSPTMLRR